MTRFNLQTRDHVFRAWPERVISFFQFPPGIRRITNTINATASLNTTLRKYTRNRRIFSNDESAPKSMYLVIRAASRRWRAIHNWKPALQVFQILFGEDRAPIIH